MEAEIFNPPRRLSGLDIVLLKHEGAGVIPAAALSWQNFEQNSASRKNSMSTTEEMPANPNVFPY